MDIDEKEKEIHFAELEKQRQQIYQQLYDDHHRKEIEIDEMFNEKNDAKSQSNQIQSNLIDGIAQIDHQGDSTDDEFFEMPLPPLPPSSPKIGNLSIDDNESVLSLAIQQTPKVINTTRSFKFPPSPTRKAPSPPPSSPPPIPPRPSSASPTNEATDQRDSALPFIVDVTPKSLLQSDF